MVVFGLVAEAEYCEECERTSISNLFFPWLFRGIPVSTKCSPTMCLLSISTLCHIVHALFSSYQLPLYPTLEADDVEPLVIQAVI